MNNSNEDLLSLLDQFAAGKINALYPRPKGRGFTAHRINNGSLGSLRGKQILLYGAGNVGRKIYNKLKAAGIGVLAFIDSHPNGKAGDGDIDIPVYLPNDPVHSAIRESCTVILSGFFALNVCREIKSALHALGFRHVYALHQMNFDEINACSFREDVVGYTYAKQDVLEQDILKLEKAFSLLETELDRGLFLSQLKAYLSSDFSYVEEPHDVALQYLAHDIPESHDYSRFVDCGGYDGDTFRQVAKYGHYVHTLAAFEPQNDLYQQYAKTLEDHPERPQQSFLFPCGVYDKTIQLPLLTDPHAPQWARISAGGGGGTSSSNASA